MIVAVDGIAVRSASQLRNRIGLARVNEQVELTVERNGAQRNVRARVDPVREQQPTEERNR